MKKIPFHLAFCATLYLAACTQGTNTNSNTSSEPQKEDPSIDASSITPSSSISLKPEKTAESATKLNFEHFGRFDLSAWSVKASKPEDGEGDFETEILTYEKDSMKLEITDSSGEYGLLTSFRLSGADGKVQKVRSLNFYNDIREAEETVNDYTVKPAKKYTRKQKMDTSYQQMNPVPTALKGAWQVGPADEL